MEFERLNPLTNEPASKATAMSPSEARAVADRAANAFAEWSARGPNARRVLLMDAAAAP
jgi:benzaldehyde dehydrogenase (NAD)